MIDSPTAHFINPIRAGSLSRRAVVTACLVPAADYLLFGQSVGISLVLFVLLVALGGLVTVGRRLRVVETTIAGVILLVALLPLIDRLQVLSVLFAAGGLMLFSLIMAGRFDVRSRRTGWMALRIGLTGSSWIFRDFFAAANRSRRRSRPKPKLAARAVTWVVPILMFGVFLWLFACGNPLIEGWLIALDPRSSLGQLDGWRLLFWCAIPILVWPFLRPRFRANVRRVTTPVSVTVSAAEPAWLALVFGPAAIFRSLVLFNGLFALQSVLDILYLWNGAALPDHMGYATYAHRGAYPLVITALLAGGFLIAATRRGSAAAHSRAIRALIHLWTAQNLLLVASSILRLDLYVAVYSLTYLRFVAFLWMLLTGTGLVLILARMSLEKSNAWLVASNFAALTSVLYLASFVDFPRVIADYNVGHSAEMQGGGAALDMGYLKDLGPRALPAIDLYIRHAALKSGWDGRAACSVRRTLTGSIPDGTSGWRAWSLDRWRLDRYLMSVEADAAGRKCGAVL